MIISLPWPDSKLSPNGRKDRRFLTSVRAKARQDGYNAALEAGVHRLSLRNTNPALEITFCAPDNRRRDLDNLLASLKPSLDGISAAMKRDDSDFAPIIINRGPVRKPGCVEIRIGLIIEGQFHAIEGVIS